MPIFSTMISHLGSGGNDLVHLVEVETHGEEWNPPGAGQGFQ